MILDNVEDWPQDVVQQENNQYAIVPEIIIMLIFIAELLKHLTTLLVL